jgi:hypothetical protein
MELDSPDRRGRRLRAFRGLAIGIPVLLFLAAASWLGLVLTRGDPEAFGGAGGRCETLIPECKMARLPDRMLTGDERDGALGPVDEVPEGILSPDEALVRAWSEDGQPSATAVQVILGSANAAKLHWDSPGRLFYAVKWSDVCTLSTGGGSPPPGTGKPRSPWAIGDWGTVIDAETGAFIVGGGSFPAAGDVSRCEGL